MNAAGFRGGLAAGLGRASTVASLAFAGGLLVFVALVAVAEKHAGLFGAADRALEGKVFGAILPLALFSVSARVFERTRLDAAAHPLARFGASRRAVGLGLIVASMLVCALLSAVVAASTAIVAHDPSAPPRAVDALTSAWIGGITGAAYAALFAFGSTFGARGGGRYWALFADFIMGSTGGFAALLVPRAHAQNLLGGAPPLLLGQPVSFGCLVFLAVAWSALSLARTFP